MEDTLTVSRLNALHQEWKKHPPLPAMVAAYLGIRPPEEGTPEELVEKLKGLPIARMV